MKEPLNELKLFMILLGSKPPQRNVEQHDFFFGIGATLAGLIPQIRAFWPEAGSKIHLDAWREVNQVDGYSVKVVLRSGAPPTQGPKLFFINLGGYTPGVFEEQHYTMLGVHSSPAQALQQAKQTAFFKTNTLKGAVSHVDDKYGIDVDEVLCINDILPVKQKDKYQILLTPGFTQPLDELHLGYFKLAKISQHPDNN